MDRAALDWAIRIGLAHGGWCPKGRRAEDGAIPAFYRLRETQSPRYEERTERNVIDSDGTLILNTGALAGGTLLTERSCRRFGKPCLLIQLDVPEAVEQARHDVRRWLTANALRVLNIAGPRESKRPGIYRQAFDFLTKLAP